MIRCVIVKHVVAIASVLAVYGIWLTWARLPEDLATSTWLAASAWTISLLAGAGAVGGATVATWAAGVSRLVQPRYQAAVAATMETIVLAPVFGWLLLNEVVYATTFDVLGFDAIALVWRNPWATLEAAWEMGAKYLIAVGVTTLVAVIIIYPLAVRAFERPTSSRTGRVVVPLVIGLVVLTGLLTWQFVTQPSESLTIVLRSAPPLRALNALRAFARIELTGPIPEKLGPPIISDETYQATMGTPRTPTPNIVFILLESVPAKALHCYGNERTDITPNLDALAAQGVLFEHALVAASFSSYGTVSTMTSLYMLRGHRYDGFADTAFPFMSLQRAIKLAGYELALFSSGNESFDHMNEFVSPTDFDTYFSHDTTPHIPKPDCMRMDDQHAVTAFEEWMAQRNDTRPFYCGFYLQSTHFNYEVPEPWASYYKPVPPLYSNGNGIIRIPADVLPSLRNQYDNAMRYADHWVGRIRAALEKAGALDNTMMVVVGDHGEAFMEHGLARHGVDVWEEMIHVPLIVFAGARVRHSIPMSLPSRVADTVSAIDVAPTLASLIGITPHPSWQGVNVLAPEYSSQDRPIFSLLQLTRWQEALVINKLKYIYDLTDVQEHLYDLNRDPGERDDLAAEQPERAMLLREMLGAWHVRQLHYYTQADRPFTHYLGPYVPEKALLNRLHQVLPETSSAKSMSSGTTPKPFAPTSHK